MTVKRHPRVLVDFDGVLHSYTSGWTGPVPTDPPEPGAREFIQRLIRDGYEVVVFTTRADSDTGAEQVRDWLGGNGFPPLRVTASKLPAVAYVDDRAVVYRRGLAWEIIRDEVDALRDRTPRRPSAAPEAAPGPVSSPAYLDVVFDGPPAEVGGRFVEVEDPAGRSRGLGTWVQRPDGYWALRISAEDTAAYFAGQPAPATPVSGSGPLAAARGHAWALSYLHGAATEHVQALLALSTPSTPPPPASPGRGQVCDIDGDGHDTEPAAAQVTAWGLRDPEGWVLRCASKQDALLVLDAPWGTGPGATSRAQMGSRLVCETGGRWHDAEAPAAASPSTEPKQEAEHEAAAVVWGLRDPQGKIVAFVNSLAAAERSLDEPWGTSPASPSRAQMGYRLACQTPDGHWHDVERA